MSVTAEKSCFSTTIPELVKLPFYGLNFLHVNTPEVPDAQRSFEKGDWFFGREYIDLLIDNPALYHLSFRATPLNRLRLGLREIIGMKITDQEVIKMAEQVYCWLPDKTKIGGGIAYPQPSVPFGHQALDRNEYSPLRSACLLIGLAELGYTPKYDKLTGLKEHQKRQFLNRIAQIQLSEGQKLQLADDSDKRSYGKTLTEQANLIIQKVFEPAISTGVEQ